VEGAANDAAAVVNRLYPNGPFDLFAGDQVVLVGRYRTAGAAKVTLRGAVGGQSQSFDFPAELVDHSDDDTNAFVAKLWATRRVGEIIDQLDLKGRNEELVNELVALATEHAILTPYTSFLADETSDVRAVAENRHRAMRDSLALDASSGEWGFNQRNAKLAYQSANQAPASGGYSTPRLRSQSATPSARRGGYGGGYGYYGGGGGGGGGGGYAYPSYGGGYEQQQQAYLPGRDRLPVGRFGLVSWQGI